MDRIGPIKAWSAIIGGLDQKVQYAHFRQFWGIDFHSAEGIISYCYDNKYIVMLVNNYKANI